MARFISCEVDGLESALLWMKEIDRAVDKVPQVFLETATEHAAKRAVVNAPILSGKLRSEITATYPVRESSKIVSATIWSKTIDSRTGFDYALYQHEFQIPSRQVPPGRTSPLGHGPRTAVQPMTPEGGAGGKYLTRSVWLNIRKYQRLLRMIMRKALSGGDIHSVGRHLDSW